MIATHPWVEEEVPEPLARKHELVAALRLLGEVSARLDARSISSEELRRLTECCHDLGREAAVLPSLDARERSLEAGDMESRLVERGPISGRSNPVAPPLRMDAVGPGGIVRASAVFGSSFEGPSGMVHGGALLAAFDEVLAFGQVPSGHIGMTATVTVRLLGPVPLHERVEFTAGTDRVEGRKIFAWAHAYVGVRLAAEATATCIKPRQREAT